MLVSLTFINYFIFCRNVKADYFAEITNIVAAGTINRNIVKEVINELLEGNPLPPLKVDIF